MDAFVAKFCRERKQHIASVFSYSVLVQKSQLQQVLARNLQRIMDADEELKNPNRVAQAAKKKPAGKKISQRTVNNIKNQTNAPRLDKLDALAHHLGCQAWQLLLEEDRIGNALYWFLLQKRDWTVPDSAPPQPDKAAVNRERVGKIPGVIETVTPVNKKRGSSH